MIKKKHFPTFFVKKTHTYLYILENRYTDLNISWDYLLKRATKNLTFSDLLCNCINLSGSEELFILTRLSYN